MRPTLDEARVHPAARQKIAGFRSELIAQVEHLCATHPVLVIGMAMNPFPGKARRLLAQQGIPYEYLGLGSYLSAWRTRLALKLWSGWSTFPMIFVGGTLIGGFSELEKLVESGELAGLLKSTA